MADQRKREWQAKAIIGGVAIFLLALLSSLFVISGDAKANHQSTEVDMEARSRIDSEIAARWDSWADEEQDAENREVRLLVRSKITEAYCGGSPGKFVEPGSIFMKTRSIKEAKQQAAVDRGFEQDYTAYLIANEVACAQLVLGELRAFGSDNEYAIKIVSDLLISPPHTSKHARVPATTTL